MNLISLTNGYLKAAGYSVSQRGRDLLIGTRKTTVGMEDEIILVWIPTIDTRKPFATQEGPYLSRFNNANNEYPVAQKFMLVPTLQGISKIFLSGARQWYNVRIRIPIQFFDTPFKGEESAEAREIATTLRKLQSRGANVMRMRVPQPYTISSSNETGKDLFGTLVDRLHSPHKNGYKSVHVIIGPAGIGKTVLFESLFAQLYANFIEDKNNQLLYPRQRPFPLLPEYLQSASAHTLKALVEAFLATDLSGPVSRSIFEWMITNKFGIWMLDGLDEIIARDPDFFLYLLELLTMPGGLQPTIVVCVRDSLLTTNDDLRDFCEEYSNVVDIYELSKWDTPSKRLFAKSFMPNKSETFMKLLRNQPEINELCSVPYYCHLIAVQYKSDSIRETYDECQLLNDAISNIIDREYKKGLLDKDLVPEAEVREFLETLAAEDFENSFQGIKRDAIEELARILLPIDLTSDAMEQFVTHLIQFAVFIRGASDAYLQFSHEILEHYLLGEYLSRCFEDNRETFMRKISIQPLLKQWVTHKIIAERVRSKSKQDDLLELLYRASAPVAFRNILQIAAFSVKDRNSLKNVPLDRRDISGVTFRGLDFSGVSFRGCDLTDVDFEACDLREAAFEGATIRYTSFRLQEKDDLNGASFGEMESFYSIYDQAGRFISDHSSAKRWVEEHTGIPSDMIEPCDAAKQLRYLFGKFIHPNGLPKRAILDKRAVLAGKNFYDREAILGAAIKQGYLIGEERYRDRLKRADGDSYSEMTQFVKSLALSEGIRNLLNDVCPIEKCSHVPSIV